MAARLMHVLARDGRFDVVCDCGYSTFRTTRESADAAADRHRTTAHPRQAQYAASKRRTRALDAAQG